MAKIQKLTELARDADGLEKFLIELRIRKVVLRLTGSEISEDSFYELTGVPEIRAFLIKNYGRRYSETQTYKDCMGELDKIAEPRGNLK